MIVTLFDAEVLGNGSVADLCRTTETLVQHCVTQMKIALLKLTLNGFSTLAIVASFIHTDVASYCARC